MGKNRKVKREAKAKEAALNAKLDASKQGYEDRKQKARDTALNEHKSKFDGVHKAIEKGSNAITPSRIVEEKKQMARGKAAQEAKQQVHDDEVTRMKKGR